MRWVFTKAVLTEIIPGSHAGLAVEVLLALAVPVGPLLSRDEGSGPLFDGDESSDGYLDPSSRSFQDQGGCVLWWCKFSV